MVNDGSVLQKRVGILVPWLSHAAGGLFDAARNLALNIEAQRQYALSVMGIYEPEFDRDRQMWGNIQAQAFKQWGPRSFGFAPELSKAVKRTVPDLLHVHGLWMYTSVVAVGWSRGRKPYIVSPHGMLDPWALNNSKLKKRISAALYEDSHVLGATCLHALNHDEAEAIRAYGITNPICVIPNGVDLPDCRQASASPETPVLLYLGRLHPKKGLANLIRALAEVRTQANQMGWQVVVAGWDQNGHQSELEALAHRLDLDALIRFAGPKFGKAKDNCFELASAFVLPSLSEGLPMSVLEAWSWQLPVLMTSACNLPEGFAVEAAVSMEPTVESISAALSRLFSMSPLDRKAMGAHGRRLVETQFHWPAIAQQMAQVYDWALRQGPQPACVLN